MLTLLSRIADQYQLDPSGLHGLRHWARVMENGLRLSQIEGGDPMVIRLFAIFHDACRRNQSIDPGHGARGAELAETLLGDLTMVTQEQLGLLSLACQEHTEGKTAANLSIQICWDADRLDLARVAIMPDPRYLCTGAAKSKAMRDWANQRALDDYAPPYVDRDWLPIFAGMG